MDEKTKLELMRMAADLTVAVRSSSEPRFANPATGMNKPVTALEAFDIWYSELEQRLHGSASQE